MRTMTIDGETFVLIKVIEDRGDAKVGDFVMHKGEVYKNLGYQYDYQVLENVETGDTIDLQAW